MSDKNTLDSAIPIEHIPVMNFNSKLFYAIN